MIQEIPLCHSQEVNGMISHRWQVHQNVLSNRSFTSLFTLLLPSGLGTRSSAMISSKNTLARTKSLKRHDITWPSPAWPLSIYFKMAAANAKVWTLLDQRCAKIMALAHGFHWCVEIFGYENSNGRPALSVARVSRQATQGLFACHVQQQSCTCCLRWWYQ